MEQEIEQTRRFLGTRLNEHKVAVKFVKTDVTAIAVSVLSGRLNLYMVSMEKFRINWLIPKSPLHMCVITVLSVYVHPGPKKFREKY